MEMPFRGAANAEGFFSGTRAALVGGTTTVIDFAVPVEGQEGLLASFDYWAQRAEDEAVTDFGLHPVITKWSRAVESDMEVMVRERGVNSFKMYLAHTGSPNVDDLGLLHILAKCRDLGALPLVHAENDAMVEEGRRRVFAEGVTGPEGHALSRPPVVRILNPVLQGLGLRGWGLGAWGA